MTRFRPCIDLHQGRVKQIVGGTLRDGDNSARENFVSDRSAAWFAELYRQDNLPGGHVILLGPGNRDAAREALAAYPQGLQVGGGISLDTAAEWLEAGASHVIVTSWLFEERRFSWSRLEQLSRALGAERLVVDLSCRRVGTGWRVATDRWQTITETAVEPELLERLAPWCAELLVHAADVEGLQQGIDTGLVELLGKASPLPCTYAGGARHLQDLAEVERLSGGRLDLTIGTALDLFGGTSARYAECVAWNREHRELAGGPR